MRSEKRKASDRAFKARRRAARRAAKEAAETAWIEAQLKRFEKPKAKFTL